MSFNLTCGWSDPSISGTARLVPTGGGQPILVPVVGGELRWNGQVGVPLDHSTNYVMFFDGFSTSSGPVSIPPIAVPACASGSTADIGKMAANAHLNLVKHH